LPRCTVSLDDWQTAQRQVRDFHYNPQRYLANPPAEVLARRQALIEASDRLRATGGPRPDRQRTFLAIRQANVELAGWEPGVAGHLAERLRQVQRQIQSNRVADDREFFYALQPRSRLAELAERLRDLLG
jgi:hypothetical protein